MYYNKTIRKAEIKDFGQIMRIWKAENVKAHDFISADYWENNFCAVKNALPQAEIYVYVCNYKIAGFIGFNGNYIEGIFVKSDFQRQGIGKALLEKAKVLKPELTLNVYTKNANAVDFYLKNDFKIAHEGTDANTNESEYTMIWKRK